MAGAAEGERFCGDDETPRCAGGRGSPGCKEATSAPSSQSGMGEGRDGAFGAGAGSLVWQQVAGKTASRGDSLQSFNGPYKAVTGEVQGRHLGPDDSSWHLKVQLSRLLGKMISQCSFYWDQGARPPGVRNTDRNQLCFLEQL